MRAARRRSSAATATPPWARALAATRSSLLRVGPIQASRLGVATSVALVVAKGCSAASSPREETSATAPVASTSSLAITPTSDQPSWLAIVTTTGAWPSGTTS